MLKKLFFVIIVISILIAWLGGIFTISFSPFSLVISKPEKDFLKRAAQKAKNIIYREATEHNPSGDLLPDQIDDNVKSEIKKIVN
jgi:hypothetical protein